MADLYITSLTIAICGVTWIKYLISPSGLFNFFPPLLEQSLAFTKLPTRITDRVQWVLAQCEKCFSGQIALWGYLVMVAQGLPYRFTQHVLLILLSVFFAGAINAILNRIR